MNRRTTTFYEGCSKEVILEWNDEKETVFIERPETEDFICSVSYDYLKRMLVKKLGWKEAGQIVGVLLLIWGGGAVIFYIVYAIDLIESCK
jgi:hypothetical protein